jgi:hypothetical protein
MRVEFAGSGWVVDGRPRLIRAGVLHYFRLPAPGLWSERVERLRAAGLNAAAVVYPWSYHSPEPGVHAFDGARDIERLHDLLERAGLYLIARPGPWVGADLDLGGLPAWLLVQPESERLDAARQWLAQILPRLAARPNLLLVELEGPPAPQAGWLRPDWLDLAVRWLGTGRLARRWCAPDRARAAGGARRSDPDAAADLEPVLRAGRRLGVEVPLVRRGDEPGCLEIPSHVHDAWGGPGHDALRERLGAVELEKATRQALEAGRSAWCYSLFGGGLTPGYLGSVDSYTAYDGSVLLDAAGRPRPAYARLRELNAAVDRVEWTLAAGGTLEALPELDEPTQEFPPAAATPGLPPPLPRLERWRLSNASPQLLPGYDDSSWTELPASAVEQGRIDLDTLSAHYGFGWYRGTFAGGLDRLVLDARHCWSVWLNGQRLAVGEALRNQHGVGPDGARLRRVPPRALRQADGAALNALVILVESLGHSRAPGPWSNPRGLVRIDVGNTPVQWRFRGGLVRGERGATPQLELGRVEREALGEVILPYGWSGAPEGVLLFETEFELNAVDPRRHVLALAFDPGVGKANLYLNGALIGRHWPERGPQRRYWLPWGVLRADAPNHLAVTLWKRTDRAALGKLRLVLL